MINLLDELKNEYGYNNPIFLEDIAKNKEENVKIRQYLLRQSKLGKIKKYGRGVYYFSKPTRLGDSIISAEDVCEKKYLNHAGEPIGFYVGIRAKNLLGLTTQVPTVYELVTNNSSAIKRDVQIGKRKYILHKAKTQITKENYLALQLLYVLNELSKDDISEYSSVISAYIKQQAIDIRPWIGLFPNVAAKLIEGNIDYVVTSR